MKIKFFTIIIIKSMISLSIISLVDHVLSCILTASSSDPLGKEKLCYQRTKSENSNHASTAYPLFRWTIRHSQSLKDLSLISTLNQKPFSHLSPTWASHNVLIKASLVQSTALLTCKQANAAIEDVIPGEVYQRSAQLGFGNKEEINASPDRLWRSRKDAAAMPFRPRVRRRCERTHQKSRLGEMLH